MSDGIPYADLVILALIAGFILLRLRSVLGQNSGNEFELPKEKPAAIAAPEPIVQVNEKSLKSKIRDDTDPYVQTLTDTELVETIQTIKSKDAQFSATGFLNGAKLAFEMAFDAFAKSDKPTLKMLLSDERYKEFSDAIDARAKEENRSESTLVSVVAKDIIHAALEKNTACLSVLFDSQQVTVVRNSDGKIIEGDASQVHHVDNHWTFERDLTSKNPNWKIIET